MQVDYHLARISMKRERGKNGALKGMEANLFFELNLQRHSKSLD